MGTSGTKGQDSFRGAGIAPKLRLEGRGSCPPHLSCPVTAPSRALPPSSCPPPPRPPRVLPLGKNTSRPLRGSREAFLLPFLRFLEFKKLDAKLD